MEFYKIFEKLVNRQFSTLQIQECLEFVEYVANKYNPLANYKVEYTMVAFQNGFGQYILDGCVRVVQNNPELFKVQVTRLFSKEGELLSTYIKQI